MTQTANPLADAYLRVKRPGTNIGAPVAGSLDQGVEEELLGLGGLGDETPMAKPTSGSRK